MPPSSASAGNKQPAVPPPETTQLSSAQDLPGAREETLWTPFHFHAGGKAPGFTMKTVPSETGSATKGHRIGERRGSGLIPGC